MKKQQKARLNILQELLDALGGDESVILEKSAIDEFRLLNLADYVEAGHRDRATDLEESVELTGDVDGSEPKGWTKVGTVAGGGAVFAAPVGTPLPIPPKEELAEDMVAYSTESLILAAIRRARHDLAEELAKSPQGDVPDGVEVPEGSYWCSGCNKPHKSDLDPRSGELILAALDRQIKAREEALALSDEEIKPPTWEELVGKGQKLAQRIQESDPFAFLRTALNPPTQIFGAPPAPGVVPPAGLDPAPWRNKENPDERIAMEDFRFNETGTRWEWKPRTNAELRAAGILPTPPTGRPVKDNPQA